MNVVLQLTYDPQCRQQTKAAFIRGNAPSLWLQEIGNWEIPQEGLICLIIPAHTGSPVPAGLFVIFGKHIPDDGRISYAYTGVDEKFFVPVHASLHPRLNEDEMSSLTTQEWQLFHPGIGFVSFSKEDALDTITLRTFTEQTDTSWDFAYPQSPQEHITVKQITILEILQREMEQQPLHSADGLIGRFRHWIGGSTEHTLRKLIDLFEKDPEKALKYAIPISSPYTGENEYRTIDKCRDWLISKYYIAAQDAANAKAYRKAAYIYAYLLSNFQAAATTLEEGSFFAEAAELYRDYLGKPYNAALCFEKGGLLADAITVLKELEQYEKAGDLYMLLSQPETARRYYLKMTDIALLKHQYTEAARLMHTKLHQTGQALAVLLQGWNSGYDQEQSLVNYLSIISEQEPARLSEHLIMILEKYTSPERESGLLSTLITASKKIADLAAKDTILAMAYQMTSTGHHHRLALLKETNRFTNNQLHKDKGEDKVHPLI